MQFTATARAKTPQRGCLHQLLHPDEQQREEHHGLMEMVEEDVVGGKAGKGIAKAAEDGILIGAHKPPDIKIGGRVPCRPS